MTTTHIKHYIFTYKSLDFFAPKAAPKRNAHSRYIASALISHAPHDRNILIRQLIDPAIYSRHKPNGGVTAVIEFDNTKNTLNKLISNGVFRH